jgi:hypothetical protein
MLASLRIHRVGFAAHFDERGIPQTQRAGRSEKPRASVTKAIGVALGLHERVEVDHVRLAQMWLAGRVHAKHRQHGGGLRKEEFHIEAKTNEHA